MNPRLISILACPQCRHALHLERDRLTCENCAGSFGMRNQTALFLPEPVQIVPAEHKSNPLGAEYEMILREGKKFVLNIGAGATAMRYANCIEFEHKIFRHTNVVGGAHCLPFRNGIFDCVFAFNVSKHLKRCARNLACLKTWRFTDDPHSFLQPLHEAPFHFYNATEHGVRSWFKYFGVEKCHVSPNFTVPFMLAFLLSQVLESVGASCGKEAREAAGQSTLRDWADFGAIAQKLRESSRSGKT